MSRASGGIVAVLAAGAMGLAALAGCSAASQESAMASLAGSSWLVQDIDGRSVAPDLQTTVAFGEDGTVAGTGGCNRFTGGAGVGAGTIAVGPLASTRMACPPAVMDQERRFFDAMARAASWSVGADGLLRLSDAGGAEILRLAPVAGG
jgi:putative lipoprotein